jgi:hypothetical protein
VITLTSSGSSGDVRMDIRDCNTILLRHRSVLIPWLLMKKDTGEMLDLKCQKVQQKLLMTHYNRAKGQ